MVPLNEYRRKRRFESTPEPSGSARSKTKPAGNRFVVQKHDARRLHYDFRLEIGGVLGSWAIPKGPSMNPADKRLAMQTEDHPLGYIDFEGLIPEGQYGAGPVIVWDRGTFDTETDVPASKQLERGEIKFTLHGRKLRGSFVLVKIRGRDGKGNPWLLIKHRDEAADTNWNIEEHDGSVISGRTLRQIEQGSAEEVRSESLQGARKATMPQSLHPMLATLGRQPFSDPHWLFEIKWDGIRALAWIQGGRAELRSRTARVITQLYPELAGLPAKVKAHAAILDGEIVVLDHRGRSDFERLQSRMNVRAPSSALLRGAPVTYCVFDIPYCDGYDLRHVPLMERKNLLRAILEPGACFVYADHVLEDGQEFFELAREQGLEGIIGKRVDSSYTEERSRDWVKIKITRTLDAVIGGYTQPRGSREHFGALLLGLYHGKSLRFIGGVGTGFTHETQKSTWQQLTRLRTERCPFEGVPQTAEEAHWVKLRLVARVKFASWTKDRRLRAPVFLGLVSDHEPNDCRFETENMASPPTDPPAQAQQRCR